ncbi:XdhC family protein [Escherichia coli]|nr:XdhC family protein [Escherichia coli]
MNIFTEAAKLEEQNCPFAMAQIVDSRGSTPRHSAQMLVRADGSIVGTIGGGMVERKVIEESLQALQERKPRLFHGRMARNGADAYSAAIFLIPICISFDTAEKRRYATYLILNRRFSFEF